MNPDSPETLAALKAALTAAQAALAAQAETIALLKWALAGVCIALASVCGFFVTWIRGLYNERLTDAEEKLKYRDGLLERVLDAVAQLAEERKLAQARQSP